MVLGDSRTGTSTLLGCMDVDNDGWWTSDPGEPSGWYDGPDMGSEPDLVSITGSANLYGLDFELFDPVVTFGIFLPLVLH